MTNHYKFFSLLIIVSFFVLLTIPSVVKANMRENIQGQLETSAQTAGYAPVEDPKKELYTTIGSIIKISLDFLGVLFLVLTIYGGFLWMTANGNADQVTKAKDMIVNATIGLALVLAAYSIVWFVMDQLLAITEV